MGGYKMKTRVEEITIWIDENGNKVAFRRKKKSESMEKMNMEELREVVCDDTINFTLFWEWLLENVYDHFNEDVLLEYWLEEKLEEWYEK